MSNKTLCFVIALVVMLSAGCSSNQTLHNTWKGTKSLWYTYVSKPAVIDYEESGEMSQYEQALSTRMMGIDVQLGQLERVMVNADKAPTPEWLQSFFARFPWISGVAGVRADGQLLGHEPADSLKMLDFLPLLAEDSKQGMRDLRGYVENSPLGPEVMVAVPLYDSATFLGVVVAHFDMRALLRFSSDPDGLVIFSPEAVLWPGRFDVSATPLAEVDWEQVLKKGSSGKVSNAQGSFYWLTRYFGNQPLVFAVPISGNFPTGNGVVGPVGYMHDRPKTPAPAEKALTEGVKSGGVDAPAAVGTAEEEHPSVTAPSPFGSHEAAAPEMQQELSEETPAAPQPDTVQHVSHPSPFGPEEAETADPPAAPEPDRIPEEETAPHTDAEAAPVFQRPSPFGPQ